MSTFCPWSFDSSTARFDDEGWQEPYVDFVKKLTTKPVVGVGRFTSADAMVSQLRRGVLDFIGAVRPSISDPFLPEKIRTGRIDEIRRMHRMQRLRIHRDVRGADSLAR